MFGKPTLLFDLDNTLLECGIYYKNAVRDGADAIAEATQMPVKQATDLIEHIDLVAIGANPHGGFQRDRFPASFAAAAAAAQWITGRTREALENQLWSIGNGVFDAPYPLYDGVEETLQVYRDAGWQLVLVTKGDREVQQAKIDKHPVIDRLFRAQYIVAKKDVDGLRSIIHREDIAVSESWMIGDSLKDDIAPAIAVELGTVHIAGSSTAGWKYDDSTVKPYTSVASVAHLPYVLAPQLYAKAA